MGRAGGHADAADRTTAADRRDAALGEAEKAVARALELDPNLAEAWASAGDIASNRLQFDRAEQMFRRAIALNPNYATGASLVERCAQPTSAGATRRLAQAERAVALDPLSADHQQLAGRQQGQTSAASTRRSSRTARRSRSIRRCRLPYGSIGDCVRVRIRTIRQRDALVRESGEP